MLGKPKELKMGGQAVIEGVMMRAEDNWAVAVRKPDGTIALKKETWRSLSKRLRLLELPVLRGALVLVETLFLGVRALSFSAEAASEEESESAQNETGFWWKVSMAGTVLFSLTAGLALFFYLPLFLTELTGIENPFWFNFVDGLLRMAVFMAYLLLISRWKDIHRVFEYHGAEHKTIATFESKQPLDWIHIKDHSRFHPRCGTSFVLILLLVSILVFLFFGKPDVWADRLVRLSVVPLIAGVSYELIKLSDRFPASLLSRIAVAPGLWLQRITTYEPDESQVEVAVAALSAAMELDRELIESAMAPAAAEG
ncbi:MAG: DUF1385 domain-containing protein [Candidatus Glassbacteria bacterium]|nr:DUF1385 domain-containing protein [Candidatus Glassbacteria bacterium]